MSPCSRDDLEGKEEEKIYNYNLSSARNVVENTFKMLVRKLRIYERKLAIS